MARLSRRRRGHPSPRCRGREGVEEAHAARAHAPGSGGQSHRRGRAGDSDGRLRAAAPRLAWAYVGASVGAGAARPHGST
jgi:hypothetical protein